MMRDLNINLRVDVNREKLLDALRANRARHLVMYTESVAGFKDHARRQLERALSRVNGTENVHLSLQAPQNMVSAYDTVIEGLEWSEQETVTLTMSEVRMLVQDKWEWMSSWLLSNRGYSETVASTLAGNMDIDD